MAVIYEVLNDIIPSDVFAAEPSTDQGYARDTYKLTLAADDVVNCGRVLILDNLDKTATLADDTTAVDAASALGLFYGADLKTNGLPNRINTEVSFDTDGGEVDVVVITRGDGSGLVNEGFLHIGNASTPASFYHNWTDAVQKGVRVKLTVENRFKVTRSTKPAIAE